MICCSVGETMPGCDVRFVCRMCYGTSNSAEAAAEGPPTTKIGCDLYNNIFLT